jgi:hypothetical protein
MVALDCRSLKMKLMGGRRTAHSISTNVAAQLMRKKSLSYLSLRRGLRVVSSRRQVCRSIHTATIHAENGCMGEGFGRCKCALRVVVAGVVWCGRR